MIKRRDLKLPLVTGLERVMVRTAVNLTAAKYVCESQAGAEGEPGVAGNGFENFRGCI